MNISGSLPKSQVRAEVRARRSGRADGGDDAFADQVHELCRLLRPVAVVGYAALAGEPDLDAGLRDLIATDTPVYLPATRKGEPLRLGRVTGPLDELPRGTWGIREPAAPLPAPEALAEFAPDATAGSAPEATAGSAPGTVAVADDAEILVLVPGLAYDARGVRLGNGGGFYDRTFGPQGLLAEQTHAGLRARLRFVGVCWDDERTPVLPQAQWDLVVGSVVTETGHHPVLSTVAQ